MNKRLLRLMGLVIASLLLAPAAFGLEATVFLNTSNNFDGTLDVADSNGTGTAEPGNTLTDHEDLAFSTTTTERTIFWFEIETTDVPDGSTISEAYLELTPITGSLSGGSFGVRQILQATGTASTTGLYLPNWKYMNTANLDLWATSTHPAGAADHFGGADSSAELDEQTAVGSLDNISLDVSAAAGIPATMDSDGFKIAFLYYGKFTATYENNYHQAGKQTLYGNSRPRLRIVYIDGSTPTPTPTPTNTFTQTPTPGATNTPTATPRIADELGSRLTNEKVAIHDQLLLEDGLAIMVNDNTDATAFQEILDEDGNYVGNLKNYVANPDFQTAITGWTSNAAMTTAFNADSVDDLDNSGSLLLTSSSTNAEATKGIDYKASHTTRVVYGMQVKGTAGQSITLKIYTSAQVVSEAHTFVTSDWETVWTAADVVANEDVTAVSVLIPAAAVSCYVDNVALYRADVLLPFMPDYLEEGGALTASSLTLTTPLGVASGGTGTSTALTEDSVVFAGASGVYTEDSTGFTFDPATDELLVGGNVVVDSLEDTTNGLAYLTNDGSNDIFMKNANGTSARVTTIANGNMTFSIDGNNDQTDRQMLFGTHFTTCCDGTSFLILQETNGAYFAVDVGIGVSAPDEALEVAGSLATIHVDSDDHAYFELDRSDTAKASSIKFQTANTTTWEVGMDNAGASTNFTIGDAGMATRIFDLDSSGNLDLTGNLDDVENIYLAERAYHEGDGDTYWRMLDDRIIFAAGGEAMIDMTETTQDIVHIGDGGDIDFNVKTAGSTNSLFVDGSNGRVGVQIAVPEAMFHAGVQGTNPAFSSTGIFENTASTGSIVSLALVSGNAADSILKFGDQNDEDVGMIRYDHSTAMEFVVETNPVLDLEADGDAYLYYGTKFRNDGLEAESGAGPHDLDTTNETLLHFTLAISSSGSIRLNQGEEGQFLILYCSLQGGTASLADDQANSDAGNVRLSAAWTPTTDATLTLWCDGTDWVEVARSLN